MSVKELGRKLLKEVEETNLHELLDDLRTTLPSSPSSSHLFKLPQLDHTINVLLPPSPPVEPITGSSPPRQSLRKPRKSHPPSIELTSLAPGSGKTHLIYHLLARCVVGTPEHKPAAAILLDTDGRCSITRLAEIVEAFIVSTRSTNATDTSVNADPSAAEQPNTTPHDPPSTAELLNTALQHIHVFRPQSLASLVSTLQSLPDYMLGEPSAHYSSNRRIGLIVLDSASAFFWQERMREEVDRVGGDGDDRAEDAGVDGEAANRASHENARQQQHAPLLQRPPDLTTALHAIQHLFSAPLIYTTTTLSSFSSSSTTTGTIPSLPPSLSALPATFPTLRILISRDVVKKFPQNLSLAALKADAAARLAVVEMGKGSAIVLPGQGWSEEVRGRMRGNRGARGFVFQVVGEGVVFE